MERLTSRTKRLSVSAVITRADGRVEDLGVIAHYDARTRYEKLRDWLLRRSF